MRDFRDAKAMAHALRDGLKARAIDITHSASLELVAQAFGYENWNILAARIEAAQPQEPSPSVPARANATDTDAAAILRCTFCHKPQHESRLLIAGPSSTYICNECVDICNDMVDDNDDRTILDIVEADEESAEETYPALSDFLRGKSAKEMASYVERARKGAERHRRTTQCIQRRLAMREGETPAKGDILASAKFAYLGAQTRDKLVALEQQAERQVKRYEAVRRTAEMMMAERAR